MYEDNANGDLYRKDPGGWTLIDNIIGPPQTPASTVQEETSFGNSSAVGISDNYAREDHTHGTPADPVPGHESSYDHSKLHDQVHGSTDHSGNIGTESQVTFDNAAGHDHDGTDSKQVAHSDLAGASTDDHHAQAHDLDSTDHTGDLSWSKVDKTGASLADLPTRNHSDLQGVSADQHHAQSHGATDHSGNIFPDADQTLGGHYLDVSQIAAPANPAAGTRRVFVDQSDGEIKVKKSDGGVVSLEGGGGTPSDSVQAETSFGQSSSAGSATTYSRGDHTHGTPADPIPAHDGASSAHASATNLEKTANKGSANGYAGLDGNTKVPTVQLGGAGADNTKYLRGDQTWAVPSGGGGTPGGSDTHVQFNDAGSFGGDAGCTYDKDTDTLSVAGEVNGSIHAFTFLLPGPASTGTNKLQAQLIIPFACTILKARANAGVAPTGAALIFDINYDSNGGADGGGSTIWTTQANRLQIAASANTGSTTTFNVTSLAAGGTLTIDIDQIGSGTAGSNICVTLVVRKSGTY